jgi:sterol 24-C-methyltransferase
MSKTQSDGQVLLASEATFEKVLHRKTGTKNVGMSAMLKKDYEAQKAASDEYFRHWDNKTAKSETKEIREVCNDPMHPWPPCTDLLYHS